MRVGMLQCFVAVARSGSLSEAALRLERTPSAVSMGLKQFQDELGAPLFKGGRKNKLTPLGHAVLTEVERTLSNLETGLSNIRWQARATTQSLRVAAVPSFTGVLLPLMVERFSAAHPEANIEVWDEDSLGVINSVLTEEVELGIATSPVAEDGVRGELFMTDSFAIYMHAAHPLAAKKLLQSSDIEGERFIQNPFVDDADATWPKLAAQESRIEGATTTALLGLVRAGIGMTVLPEMVRHLEFDGVVSRRLEHLNSKRELYIVRKGVRPLSPLAQEFLTILRATALEHTETCSFCSGS